MEVYETYFSGMPFLGVLVKSLLVLLKRDLFSFSLGSVAGSRVTCRGVLVNTAIIHVI